MNFLAKRDGTFQYVSKLANWRVEATHPDIYIQGIQK